MSRRHAITRAVFRIALRTLKWGTLAAALLIAGVWAGGRATKFGWDIRYGTGYADVIGSSGRFVVTWYDPASDIPGEDLRRAVAGSGGLGSIAVPNDPNSSPSDFWPHSWLPSVHRWGFSHRRAFLPYWLPILLFASISGGLFWRDRRAARRARVGMCPSCGYSRAGLALDAVCPECAAAAP